MKHKLLNPPIYTVNGFFKQIPGFSWALDSNPFFQAFFNMTSMHSSCVMSFVYWISFFCQMIRQNTFCPLWVIYLFQKKAYDCISPIFCTTAAKNMSFVSVLKSILCHCGFFYVVFGDFCTNESGHKQGNGKRKQNCVMRVFSDPLTLILWLGNQVK